MRRPYAALLPGGVSVSGGQTVPMTTIPAVGPPDAVVDLLAPGTNLIVPLANGEPVAVLDAVEAAADAGALEGVRVHQMHALHDRPYLDGRHGDRLHHV